MYDRVCLKTIMKLHDFVQCNNLSCYKKITKIDSFLNITPILLILFAFYIIEKTISFLPNLNYFP